MYEAIRILEQVGVLSWVNRPPGQFGNRCNDVARSRVVGSASTSRGSGAARRQSGECGNGPSEPSEPGRRNPMQRRCAEPGRQAALRVAEAKTGPCNRRPGQDHPDRDRR